jgi:hypothetical protein
MQLRMQERRDDDEPHAAQHAEVEPRRRRQDRDRPPGFSVVLILAILVVLIGNIAYHGIGQVTWSSSPSRRAMV